MTSVFGPRSAGHPFVDNVQEASDPHDAGQAGQRRRDTSLSDKSARLSWLPAQGTMLSKGVRPQNPAQYLRGSSRRCPGAGQDRGVQAIIPRQKTCRNAVCALEAHPAPRQAQAERSVWCSRRVPPRCYSPEPPKAGKADPDARPNAGLRANKLTRALIPCNIPNSWAADFFNTIGAKWSFGEIMTSDNQSIRSGEVHPNCIDLGLRCAP